MEGAPKQPKPFQKPDEFEFHQERFKRADESRDVVSKFIVKAEKYVTNDTREFTDAAYSEAERDNIDHEKRSMVNSPEFRESYENLQLVVNSLKDKRDNPDTSKTQAILFGMGAGMRIPYGIGQALALNQMGITAKTFKALYGTSASSALVAYFSAGKEMMLKGAAMVCETLATTDFINKTKVPEIVNLRFFKKEMEEGEAKLDQADVQNSEPDVKFVVTRPGVQGQDPQAEFLDAKKLPNVADGVRASMSIDHVTGEIPEINGISFRDGGFDPAPFEKIIDDYQKEHGEAPTDMLVLVNTPFETREEFKLSFLERAGVSIAKKFGSLTQVEKILIIRELLRQSLEYTEDLKKRRGVHIGIVWPPNMGLGTLTINPDDMKAAALESARGMFDAFGEEQPKKIDWYDKEQKGTVQEEEQKQAA